MFPFSPSCPCVDLGNGCCYGANLAEAVGIALEREEQHNVSKRKLFVKHQKPTEWIRKLGVKTTVIIQIGALF